MSDSGRRPGLTWKRSYALAKQYLLCRSLPHGMIHWRYLFPRPSKQVRIHRRLWLLGRPPRLPLALYFILEFLLWLRWVTYAGWRRSWHAVKLRGSDIEVREGIGRLKQFLRVLSLSLGYCIRPAEIYSFGLYQRDAKPKIWTYVFVQEVPAFHSWRNIRLGMSGASKEILQDKWRTTDILTGQGIPAVPVLKLALQNEPFDPSELLKTHPHLFCKPRHGSAGRNNFLIGRPTDEEKPTIRSVDNGIIGRPSIATDLRQAMAQDDFLIQPCVDNHPDLAELSRGADAVTLRLITELHPRKNLRYHSATLEIPTELEGIGARHIVFPVDILSGLVLRFPDNRLSAGGQARHEDFYKRMGHLCLPFWNQIKEIAAKAHASFPDVYAIAWDFVMAPTGPLILEGNTGWGTAIPQVLHGGLLTDQKKERT